MAVINMDSVLPAITVTVVNSEPVIPDNHSGYPQRGNTEKDPVDIDFTAVRIINIDNRIVAVVIPVMRDINRLVVVPRRLDIDQRLIETARAVAPSTVEITLVNKLDKIITIVVVIAIDRGAAVPVGNIQPLG